MPLSSACPQIYYACAPVSSNCKFENVAKVIHQHNRVQFVNKYFELKNSWGYRPHSNYLLHVFSSKSGHDNM